MTDPPERPEPPPTIRDRLGAMSFAEIGLFVLAVIYSVYLSRTVLLPIILALLVTLLLSPIHGVLVSWLRLPKFPAALLLVAGVVAALTVGLVHLGEPASRYASQFDQEIVRARLQAVFTPIKGLQQEIKNVAENVSKVTGGGEEAQETPEGESPPTPAKIAGERAGGVAAVASRTGPPSPAVGPAQTPVEKEVLQVSIREDPTEAIYGHLQEFVFHAVVTLILCCFLLGFGEAMQQQIARDSFAGGLLKEIQRDVSHYLLSITAINFGLGGAIALAMYLLDMPSPILWGVMAAVLNFIPYVGAIIGGAIIFIVAVVTFPEPAPVFAVTLSYIALTFIEGNFVTPTIIGHRFTINPIVVFVWVTAWGALWGMPGMLIGLPLLMVFRIVCSKVPALHGVERVISARSTS